MNDLFVIKPNNRLYKKALRREISVWKNKKPENFIDAEFHEYSFDYLDSKYHFRKNSDWIDFISKFGPFENAVVLGGGETSLENYLLNKNIVKKIKNIDIINEKGFKKDQNSFQDLNFIRFTGDQFDLIIAKSILHHIVNLEHLILQVNKALTKDGIFLVFEYVGENKQQWDPYKITIINNQLHINEIIPGYVFDKLKHNYFNNWPFESIRSQEIPEILGKVFVNVLQETWGGLRWPIVYHIKQICYKKKITLDEVQKKILYEKTNDLEKKYIDDKQLLPSYLFGVYKKNHANIQLDIPVWDKTKISKELKLNGPIKVRFKTMLLLYNENKFIKFLIAVKSKIKRIL
jgi:SAM-dependent methyltransferase